MGYKASIITIQNPLPAVTDRVLLDTLGLNRFQYAKETTLEECIYPRDKSINIGEFNNCLIICDDFQLVSELEDSPSYQSLCSYEESLSNLFPASEILTVVCHSGINYHLYMLVRNGQKVRFKTISSGGPLVEFGDRIKEEEEVYAHSKIIDGKRLFRSFYRFHEEDDNYDFNEDQMMEEFTFGVAARHLGVKISTADDDELMFNVPFRKYLKS